MIFNSKNKQKSQKILFILFLVFCHFFCSCQNSNLPKKELTIQKQDGTFVKLKAELAIKPEQRNYGFMNRKNIPQGTGMLFIFENEQILNFWMKNTPTPLSIAYITTSGKIRDIFDMTPYSLANVTSTGHVRYALEVPQGWFKKQGIKVGDKLIIDFN